MKIRNFLLALGLLGLVFAQVPAADAQVLSLNVAEVKQVGGQVTDDGDTALVCRYIGTEEDGEIAVESDGNLTFISGDAGSEVADTTLECPVSGALGGIIDVSDAACDTVVEVLDIINAAASDWRCVPIAALGTDGTNDTLLAASTTTASSFGGLALKWDTSVALEISHAFTEKTTIEPYCSGGANCSGGLRKNRKPEAGLTSVINYAHTISTYGSGDSFLNCYSVDWYIDDDDDYTETITQVYSRTNAATATAAYFDDELVGGIFSKPDEKLICRIDNSAALASATLTVSGLQYVH